MPAALRVASRTSGEGEVGGDVAGGVDRASEYQGAGIRREGGGAVAQGENGLRWRIAGARHGSGGSGEDGLRAGAGGEGEEGWPKKCSLPVLFHLPRCPNFLYRFINDGGLRAGHCIGLRGVFGLI